MLGYKRKLVIYLAIMEEARFSVAQFNEMINATLQGLGDIVVEGEITQLNVSSKGGVNIVLKDPKATALLNISGYAPRIEGLQLIKEGMQVAAWGNPNIWSAGGRFSLQIFKILPLGEGALKEAYEQLRRKLTAEGLFAAERKRELPQYITKIALITGKESAAQSDFYKILTEHHFGATIDYYPVQVQGKHAEAEIITALKLADKKNYDCVVLVRGGGSLEDLITFNSEKVARTIYAMSIPVVVGIGHEKDESIADFVADVRAATPSQAAYYLVGRNQAFAEEQLEKALAIKTTLQNRLLSYTFTLEQRRNKVFQLMQALLQQWQYYFAKKTGGISQRLIIVLQQIKIKTQQLEFQTRVIPRIVEQYQLRISSLERLLTSFNPQNVIKRGYAIIKTDGGSVVTSIKDANIGINLNLTVKDGTIISTVIKTHDD